MFSWLKKPEFPELVGRHFSFLEETGFHVAEATDRYVRYESERAVVQVYHGRISHEVGVEIGPRGGFEEIRVFGMYDIMWSLGIIAPAKSAHSVRAVERDIRKFAAYVRDYCGPGLSGDPLFFRRVIDSLPKL